MVLRLPQCPALPMVQLFVEVATQAPPRAAMRASSALACTLMVLRLLECPALPMEQLFMEDADGAAATAVSCATDGAALCGGSDAGSAPSGDACEFSTCMYTDGAAAVGVSCATDEAALYGRH